MTDKQENPTTEEEVLQHMNTLLITEEIEKIVIPAKFADLPEPVYVMCASFLGSNELDGDTFLMPLAIIMDDNLRLKLELPDEIEAGDETLVGGEDKNEGN